MKCYPLYVLIFKHNYRYFTFLQVQLIDSDSEFLLAIHLNNLFRCIIWTQKPTIELLGKHFDMTLLTGFFTHICQCHHVSQALNVCIYVPYVCYLCLLIISSCSTCRDVCQLCTDRSHLLSFLSVHSFFLSLSSSLGVAVSLPHTCTNTFNTIHSLNLPSSLQAKFRSFVSVSGLSYNLACQTF